jgi:hypothetical protein
VAMLRGGGTFKKQSLEEGGWGLCPRRGLTTFPERTPISS